MRTEHEAAFAAFVAARADDLLRVAELLADDRGHAEELLQAALLRAHRTWGDDPDPHPRLLGLLVTGAAGRRRTTQEVGALPARDPAGYDRDAGPAAVATALAALPLPLRAVLVLRHGADLSEPATAAALGVPVDTVRSRTGQALAALGATLPTPLPGGAGSDLAGALRDQLAARLVRRAPTGLAQRTRELHRRRRRRQAAVAGAGLAVALLGASVLGLRGALPDVDRADAPAPSAAAPLADLADLPTRGPLAGQADWLSAVAALDWASPGLSPLAGTRRVAWAGDVGGERIALVLGRADGDTPVLVWFTGPAGAAADQMTQAALMVETVERQPLAFVDVPAGATGVLVVVAHPGDQVSYLAGRTVDADGEEVEDRRDLVVHDGVATTTVSGDAQLASGVDVVHGGRSSVPYLVASPRTDSRATGPLDDPRGLRPDVPAAAVAALLSALTGRYGEALAPVTPVLLAGGTLPGTGEALTLVGLTFPSGGTAVWTGEYRTDPAGGSSSDSTAGSRAPAGVPLADQLVAVTVADGAVAVSGPAPGVAAQLLGPDDRLLGTVPLRSGAGVGTAPGAVRVRVLDAGGATLAEGPVTPG